MTTRAKEAHFLNGGLEITRLQGGGAEYDGMVRLRLIDGNSSCVAFEILVAPEQFALAITGLSNQPVRFKAFDAPIGKQREHKDEAVLLPESSYTPKGKAEAISNMKAFETDGWMGEERDLFNHHRHSRDKSGQVFAQVGFTRYVEVIRDPS